MLQQLSNANTCTWQLKNKVIDVSMATSEASPSPTVVSLENDSLYAGPDTTSSIIATAGKKLPTSLNRINVATVNFRNIYATGNPNEYKGVFMVMLDSSSLARPMKPIQIQQIIKTVTTDPANAKRIESCAGVSSTTTWSAFTNIRAYTNPGGHSYTVPNDVSMIQVEVWGAGGECAGVGLFGSTGGGGGYSFCIISVTPGEVYTMYIGTSGAAPSYINYGSQTCGAAGGSTLKGGDGTTTAQKGIISFINLKGENGVSAQAGVGFNHFAIGYLQGGLAPRAGSEFGTGCSKGGDGPKPGAIHVRW